MGRYSFRTLQVPGKLRWHKIGLTAPWYQPASKGERNHLVLLVGIICPKVYQEANRTTCPRTEGIESGPIGILPPLGIRTSSVRVKVVENRDSILASALYLPGRL